MNRHPTPFLIKFSLVFVANVQTFLIKQKEIRGKSLLKGTNFCKKIQCATFYDTKREG